jgi:hypothetical protein
VHLAKGLKVNKSIKVCHVSNNKLSTESVQYMAEVLMSNHVLKDLDLSFN